MGQSSDNIQSEAYLGLQIQIYIICAINMVLRYFHSVEYKSEEEWKRSHKGELLGKGQGEIYV